MHRHTSNHNRYPEYFLAGMLCYTSSRVRLSLAEPTFEFTVTIFRYCAHCMVNPVPILRPLTTSDIHDTPFQRQYLSTSVPHAVPLLCDLICMQ